MTAPELCFLLVYIKKSSLILITVVQDTREDTEVALLQKFSLNFKRRHSTWKLNASFLLIMVMLSIAVFILLMLYKRDSATCSAVGTASSLVTRSHLLNEKVFYQVHGALHKEVAVILSAKTDGPLHYKISFKLRRRSLRNSIMKAPSTRLKRQKDQLYWKFNRPERPRLLISNFTISIKERMIRCWRYELRTIK